MIFQESIPTKRQLIKRYGTTIFPNNETDDCCANTHYLMDFVTHRVLFHKISIRETLEELDEFMRELWVKDMESKK